MKFSQIKPVSHLKTHAEEMVKTITESGERYLITQNGEATVVVQAAQVYEGQQQTLALLKILALGQKAIDTGKFREVDDVFTELDEEDAKHAL
ncbi:type II toxin-antitoxin system Phd/YefM family antitoxin [Paraburkholderia sp. Cpub6]|uniref:type II toxin-antitoxin system Phd/YefM family antitoxin n=1 Tax=Paraburkholderia sp. Cpub6 TaxID=2723094 RepID=UPI00161760C5|nr:type II toxin-antitoxin system Phd/YefM family antitoxin [Paraburkholderia sp. Cpub6]MBB5460240.1 PHD/YefM family antitoxin component YafN of YafNO toxin-antitoxin module [Paraburkholderia sp. Cpub6]